MDYHQKALNIQKSGSGVVKAMTAETCVLMGMCKSKMGEYQSALDVRRDLDSDPLCIKLAHEYPLHITLSLTK